VESYTDTYCQRTVSIVPARIIVSAKNNTPTTDHWRKCPSTRSMAALKLRVAHAATTMPTASTSPAGIRGRRYSQPHLEGHQRADEDRPDRLPKCFRRQHVMQRLVRNLRIQHPGHRNGGEGDRKPRQNQFGRSRHLRFRFSAWHKAAQEMKHQKGACDRRQRRQHAHDAIPQCRLHGQFRQGACGRR
jgi:hypothetical protein